MKRLGVRVKCLGFKGSGAPQQPLPAPLLVEGTQNGRTGEDLSTSP